MLAIHNLTSSAVLSEPGNPKALKYIWKLFGLNDPSLQIITGSILLFWFGLGFIATLERCLRLLLGLFLLFAGFEMVILMGKEKESSTDNPFQTSYGVWMVCWKKESLSSTFLDSTTGISLCKRLRAKGPNQLGCKIGDVLVLSSGGFEFEGLGSIPITPKASCNEVSESLVYLVPNIISKVWGWRCWTKPWKEGFPKRRMVVKKTCFCTVKQHQEWNPNNPLAPSGLPFERSCPVLGTELGANSNHWLYILSSSSYTWQWCP